MEHTMTVYTVVINHQGETASLTCESMEEAQMVRRSFINWGGFGYDINIVVDTQTV
jgi:hypothetical protein